MFFIFAKGNNFGDFLHASKDEKALRKRDYSLEGKNFLLRNKFLHTVDL